VDAGTNKQGRRRESLSLPSLSCSAPPPPPFSSLESCLEYSLLMFKLVYCESFWDGRGGTMCVLSFFPFRLVFFFR
jgi:hypothetical protein